MIRDQKNFATNRKSHVAETRILLIFALRNQSHVVKCYFSSGGKSSIFCWGFYITKAKVYICFFQIFISRKICFDMKSHVIGIIACVSVATITSFFAIFFDLLKILWPFSAIGQKKLSANKINITQLRLSFIGNANILCMN